jgi:hypothetical protein
MKRFAGCVLLIMVLLIQMIAVEGYAYSANIRPGNIYVGVKKLTSRDAKKIGMPLNHPYELSEDVVANALSSIYYGEKGLFKVKKKTRRAVFTSTEVRTLAPRIADALPMATATEYVIVYSAVQRALLSDLHTYCMVFITSLKTRDGWVNELNVAFANIRQRLSHNITESEKARIEKLFNKPVNVKKSTFWEIIPVKGQRLKEGHQNWLLIDLMAVPIRKPVARGKVQGQALPNAAYAGELEERVRKLEQKSGLAPAEEFRKLPEVMDEDTYIRVDAARDFMPKRHPDLTVESREIEELKKLGVKEKLRKLRALRDERLITDSDYRSKKAQLIRKEQKDKSIREKLKELRDMRDEKLITEKDYEMLKKELLDKWF